MGPAAYPGLVDVVIAGSHGLIGTALRRHLIDQGHRVRRLVRGEPRADAEFRWDPDGGTIDRNALLGADIAVNLAGAGVGDHRWTPRYKKEILESRTHPTRTLAHALATAPDAPRTLIQASAIGYYGDRGDEVLTESSSGGTGFLSDVVAHWEAATAEAAAAGVRVAHVRSGLVFSQSGGALGRLLPLLRLGVGGHLGSGQQYWSWISLEDEVRAITYLMTASISGPVNATAPAPTRHGEVVAALAAALHRPAVLPVPAPALRLALGEFSSEILGSQRVLPEALTENGFAFHHGDVTEVAEWVTASRA